MRWNLKFKLLSLPAIVISITLFCCNANVFAVDTENFYFESYEADYYLSHNSDNTSNLKVIENFTTVFPNYKQNKGICRDIPFTNQDGVNITLRELNKSNVMVLRNGMTEPIYSIDKYDDYWEVCTGDDDYVLGTQIYTFEYRFDKVVTDFDTYQELYWDTNGTDWSQKFNSVTVRVHFDDQETIDGWDHQSWCYVGKSGSNDQTRCTITEIGDGLQFSANTLSSRENLTFDVQFKPDTFTVPDPEKDYILVYITIAIICGTCLLLIKPIRRYSNILGKKHFYKGYFIKPEYQPHDTYSLSEMAEIYKSAKKKDVKVAVLLDMVVKKKIRLIKEESSILGKNNWSIIVGDIENISKEELKLLMILHGAIDVTSGCTITITEYEPKYKFYLLWKEYGWAVKEKIVSHKLVTSKYKIGESSNSQKSQTIISLIFGLWLLLPFVIIPIETCETLDAWVYGKDFLPLIMAGIVIATFVTIVVLNRQSAKYETYTIDGLRASRYMDGLKLYIEMAEADRFKLLQSVEGVDITPEGIVRLYEKLLPYAAVFGLEKSWMKNLSHYFDQCQNLGPDDVMLMYGNSIGEIGRVIEMASSSISHAYHYSTGGSSGGGSFGGGSSSSSGGGGGGSSGGGGGGGGGHGR